MAVLVCRYPILLCVLLLITCFVGLAIAQPSYGNAYFCLGGNYSNGSPYRRNLESVLSSLSSSNITNIPDAYAFYNLSSGQSPDRVFTIALCRGDVEPDVCRSCLVDLTRSLVGICPNKKVAIGWYEKCMFRYSDNGSIYHNLNLQPQYRMHNRNNVSNLAQFNEALKNLTGRLKAEAARGGSLFKFATGNTSISGDFPIIYGLVQCTPDLTQQQCYSCLETLEGVIPLCCNGNYGGVILAPSCNLRYEIYTYYNETPANALSPPIQEPLLPPESSTPGMD